MGLYIEIIEGIGVGTRYPVKAGSKIGRTEGDIQIADPKISSLHAKIEAGTGEQLFLTDLSSANGIRIRGQKVSKVILMPGVIFSLGKTVCTVVLELQPAPANPEDITLSQNLPPVRTPEKPPIKNPAPKAASPIAKDWRAILNDEIFSAEKTADADIEGVRVFDPIVSLKVTEGIQINKQFILGYGPRTAGADSLDLELLEPQLNGIAFTIIPLSDGAVIECKNPEALYNGKKFISETLRSGDKIRIGDTLIEVSFMDNNL